MNEALRNRAAASILLLTAGLMGGLAYVYYPAPTDCRHSAIAWVGDAGPSGPLTDCWLGVVRGPSEAWSAFGICQPDGGTGLAAAKVCFHVPAECADGGSWYGDAGFADTGLNCTEQPDAEPSCAPGPLYPSNITDKCATHALPLPAGVEYAQADEWTRPAVPGEPVFEAWEASHPGAPWRCACASEVPDAGPCEKLVGMVADAQVWAPASPGQDMSLGPDKWRGSGCVPQPCGAWGSGTTPAACCLSACVGRTTGTSRCGTECGPPCAPGWEIDSTGYNCREIPPDAGEPDAGEPADAE